jgi:hypothetical protein
LTEKVGDALPIPEPGETSAHGTSVRAAHAQFDAAVSSNANRPPAAVTDVGRPDSCTLHDALPPDEEPALLPPEDPPDAEGPEISLAPPQPPTARVKTSGATSLDR